MPWLTFGAPVRITPLHQAQTSVGNTPEAMAAFFMIGVLDRAGAAMFDFILG